MIFPRAACERVANQAHDAAQVHGGDPTRHAPCGRLGEPPHTRVEATWIGRLDQLPHFDPDVEETNLPEPARRLRGMVEEAAGVVVCCPEYAHGASGVMKMTLEWLVGGTEMAAKPTMLVNVSTSNGGGLRAQRWLEETLTVMGVDVRPAHHWPRPHAPSEAHTVFEVPVDRRSGPVPMVWWPG